MCLEISQFNGYKSSFGRQVRQTIELDIFFFCHKKKKKKLEQDARLLLIYSFAELLKLVQIV